MQTRMSQKHNFDASDADAQPFVEREQLLSRAAELEEQMQLERAGFEEQMRLLVERSQQADADKQRKLDALEVGGSNRPWWLGGLGGLVAWWLGAMVAWGPWWLGGLVSRILAGRQGKA